MAYLKGVLNELTVPAANNTDNGFINDVVGQKSDTAASGSVTATDTLVAYVKQLVTEGIARDAVIGALNSAAATGAVTDTDVVMAYIKQLVTELQVVDGYLDVPVADVATNTTVRDAVGNKTDAAVIAKAADKSAMAYLKGVLDQIGTLTNTAGTAALGSMIGDPANSSLVARLALIYAQLLRGTGTVLPDNQSLYDLIAGTNGIATWSAGAAPANGVSLAEGLRDVWDALRNGTGGAEPAADKSVMDYLGVSPAFFVPGLGYAVTKTEAIADDSTTDDLFTVTGKVLITVWTGEVKTDAIGADCTDYKLRVKTDNIDLCAASDIHSAAATFMWQMTGNAGDTLINTASAKDTADNNGKGIANRIVGISGGTATIQSLHTDPNTSTATMLHTLFYLPLEAGASVAAAA